MPKTPIWQEAEVEETAIRQTVLRKLDVTGEWNAKRLMIGADDVVLGSRHSIGCTETLEQGMGGNLDSKPVWDFKKLKKDKNEKRNLEITMVTRHMESD
ncbi:hypothetical protein TNCV_4027401 [Trichonephila clavipes]|nr:hypothetical protein TNCV_4027401 [Trichonephila clavipes]